MEPETSQFESSEMLATFLASTPLLEDSWRLCSHANTAAQRSFVVNRVGTVAYVAFSGVQVVDCSEESCRSMVEIEKGIFGAFSAQLQDQQKQPIMVHGGLLHLFLSFYYTHNFQHKMLEIVNESKSVVFTGHSVGGALASLSALWLLSTIRTTSVVCITYGSIMLGNESFSQAILQERWGGNFCHIVAHHDIVPRLLFAPSSPFFTHIRALFDFWHLSMTSPPHFTQLASQLCCNENNDALFVKVLACVELSSRGGEDEERSSPFWPFGSYLFCTENGAICLDNGLAIIKFLYLMLATGSPTSSIEDHLKYEYYVGKICWQYLQKKSFNDVYVSESSNEAGIALALQSSGIPSQEPTARNCLAMARQLGCRRNLNNAKMALSLAKITPLRAQIEWYKAFCDSSDDQMGYYDSFKRRSASKRGNKVNMNRIKLGQFWDEVINMLEKNQLTHDFHKLPKYVNASQFYKLLVEPLEIAEYYRTGMHKTIGHYMEHGRGKRFKIFDNWWRDGRIGDKESRGRSKFASSTQDSCFWARVEEARDSVYHIMSELDLGRRLVLLDKIEKFEQYANGMIERKEVSIDVLAKYSSYNLFREEWKEVKTQLQQVLPPRFPDGTGEKIV